MYWWLRCAALWLVARAATGISFVLSKETKDAKVKGQWALALGTCHQSAAPILGYTLVGVRCGL